MTAASRYPWQITPAIDQYPRAGNDESFRNIQISAWFWFKSAVIDAQARAQLRIDNDLLKLDQPLSKKHKDEEPALGSPLMRVERNFLIYPASSVVEPIQLRQKKWRRRIVEPLC